MSNEDNEDLFIEAGGVNWRYRRSGHGATVLLLHTLRTQLEYFDQIVEILDNVDVVIPDLPGHGESSAPEVTYSASYFIDSVASLIDRLQLREIVVVGESIGAVIALGLAARQHPSVIGVIALNPYDYGIRGGIRRSSGLANLIFSAMLVPGLGWIVARAGPPPILRKVMEGGFENHTNLKSDFIQLLFHSGIKQGHPRVFRSLCLEWQSWIEARNVYRNIAVPTWLAYSDSDWSRLDERQANKQLLPDAHWIELGRAGHFSCLEVPSQIAKLITDAVNEL
ncbi:MAG: alpha/beta hydrolase [Candidatus Thiodiazotropha sp. (ex Lucina aurantia)]|nr:alpha/beta hydrolase [Candidatus Thiodiazotropha sp. (ex Lucina pensylvanica)]MBT3022829.1 alpha/beta hydrolase [Candidatus Thiodiazotropha taylori]MBV2099736.1 alpha/beta hydrolase [Candidatus Thiodiazotropha sp. (ex Codakia orbicularis)]MBV2101462.1 alpha/beta hydrolase [Candidatus Thiodiazotropha sp. (ex Lucina aurantia)]MBV2115867.1 alpha/beta hydrolase [Candidatus Thiodiazotropha sp. (ex Lucina aurantia)]